MTRSSGTVCSAWRLTVASSAFGYLFWLLAAHLYSPAIVGLTAAVTSATAIMLLLSGLGVGGMLIQSLPRQPKETGGRPRSGRGWQQSTLFALALCGIGVTVLPLISPELVVLRGAAMRLCSPSALSP